MSDHRKAVKLRWIATAAMLLIFMAAARFGLDADRAFAATSKSDPSGASSASPQAASANPLLDKLCFPCKGPTTIKGSEWITIDPVKRYTLTGWFRSVGKDPSSLYFGYMCFDADKRLIAPEQVGVLGATETVLHEDCKKEDTLIKVAHAFKWKEDPHACIAFDVDDSGKYADLPNRNLSGFGILKIEEKEGYWEVRLNEPCGRAYPAGTKVREHSAGPAYLYCAAAAQSVPAEWTQYSGTVAGLSTAGAGNAHWWQGTKYAKLVLLLNSEQNEDCIVLVGGLDIRAETP
ncbi:MAG: hypothetical protein ABSA67_12910 [Candidatus Brocadiia bacterium]|jgi:hypothetical protein